MLTTGTTYRATDRPSAVNTRGESVATDRVGEGFAELGVVKNLWFKQMNYHRFFYAITKTFLSKEPKPKPHNICTFIFNYLFFEYRIQKTYIFTKTLSQTYIRTLFLRTVVHIIK